LFKLSKNKKTETKRSPWFASKSAYIFIGLFLIQNDCSIGIWTFKF